MISLLNFAAETGPHIAIAPEEVLQIGPIHLTNSNIYAWVAGLVITILLITAARSIGIKATKGWQQFIEMGAEFVISLLESNLLSRKKAVTYAPIFASIFFFILLNNWMGLLPGVGPAIEFNDVPLFRPFTADLNGTLALAISAIFIVQYFFKRFKGVG